ncbi:MAG: tetratricopeptide repeat protein, partial [Candidatus Omnitrophica bacterium]|nr:tetratricopeptide repeat protein [Candidatus Omnitrophota bacterium]
MKKYLVILFSIGILIFVAFRLFIVKPAPKQYTEGKVLSSLNQGFELLRLRRDKEALLIFEQILLFEPSNIDARWGKAEVLRRMKEFLEAEKILTDILKETPQHQSSMISLAYIRYKDDKLNEAKQLINDAIEIKPWRKEEL